MNAVIEFIQTLFNPTVLVFTVSNLAAMGLQVKMPNLIAALRDKRFLSLVFVWGWVLGPAFGYLITKVLPLEEPYVIVVLLTSLAPCRTVPPAGGGKSPRRDELRGSLHTLDGGRHGGVDATDGTPADPGADDQRLGARKPLLLTVLLPLISGVAIRKYAATVANKVFPAVKAIAVLSTLATIVFCVVLYGRAMLNTAGSYALLSMTLFMVGMGLITYRFGFGLKQAERTVMALGMGTRNIAAVLAGALAIPNADPRIVVMVIMWTLWSVVSRCCCSHVGPTGRQEHCFRRSKNVIASPGDRV